MTKYMMDHRVGIVVVRRASQFEPFGILNRSVQSGHQLTCRPCVSLLIAWHVHTANTIDHFKAFRERGIPPFKVEQNPQLETRDGNCLSDRQRIPSPTGKCKDLRACTLKALVPIAIEDAKHSVIATAFQGLLLGALHDADRGGANCVLGNYNLGRRQGELNSSRLEIFTFRVTLTDNQSNRPGFALPGAAL
jgi:hypothetical protein